jgi:hypothetical protein
MPTLYQGNYFIISKGEKLEFSINRDFSFTSQDDCFSYLEPESKFVTDKETEYKLDVLLDINRFPGICCIDDEFYISEQVRYAKKYKIYSNK